MTRLVLLMIALATLHSACVEPGHAAGAGTSWPHYPPEQSYSLALHTHASMSEQYGSMEWHTVKAESIGVDVIWWSEHDWRLSNGRFMQEFGFETATWDATYHRWTEADDAWLGNFRYWDTDAASLAVVQTSISDTLAFEGSRSLLLEAAGGIGAEFFSGYLDQTTMQFNNRYSLAKHVNISFALYPELLDPQDSRFVVEVELSDHPDGTKILRYVAGTMDGEGAHSIPLPFTLGTWNEYTLDVTADAIEHFSIGGADSLRAEDNSLGMVRIGFETRNQTPARALFDDYRLAADPTLVGDVLLNRARTIGAYYEGLYPGVTHYAGTEISRFQAQPHMNGFAPALELVDYTGHTWSDSLYYAVDQLHTQRGAISLNHVFGPRFGYPSNPDETPEERAARHLWVKRSMIAIRAYGVDILEVGYRLRGAMTLGQHLDLWDALNANAIWITGNGVTDSHGRGEHGLIGWGPATDLSTINNFVTWLHTAEFSESGFVQAMRQGRAYFGDPYLWQGDLDLHTLSGFRMGQVIVTDRSQDDLVIEVTNVPPDVQVRLVQAEIRDDPPADYSTVNYLRDEIRSGAVVGGTYADTVSIDLTLPSLVRVEVTDGAGEGFVYGNPIHFVQSVPQHGTPAERVAVDLAGVRVFLAEGFVLTDASFDAVGEVLTLAGDEEAPGLGSLSIDPGTLGEPATVEGAAAWIFQGGVLELQGFSGLGSVIQVAWSATGIGEGSRVPAAFDLGPSRPNPFGGGTVLDYSLPHAGNVRLEIFEVSGRRIRVLEDGVREAGVHEVRWNGHDQLGRPVAAGVYYLRVRYGGETAIRKIVKLRR